MAQTPKTAYMQQNSENAIKRKVVADMLIDLAREGAKLTNGKYGKMCSSCAFRSGTEANNDEIVFAAADCVIGCPHPFYCHEDEESKCVGFLYAIDYCKYNEATT